MNYNEWKKKKNQEPEEIKKLRKKYDAYKSLKPEDIIHLENLRKQINRMKVAF